MPSQEKREILPTSGPVCREAIEILPALTGEGDATYLVPVLAMTAGAAADGAVRARAQRRLDEATRLAGVAADVLGEAEAALRRIPAVLPPAAASLAVARAEAARAAGIADARLWAEAAAQWQALGDSGQRGYALLREAECHLPPGGGRGQASPLAEAGRVASDAGAEHLLAATGALAGRARLPLQPTAVRPSTGST